MGEEIERYNHVTGTDFDHHYWPEVKQDIFKKDIIILLLLSRVRGED